MTWVARSSFFAIVVLGVTGLSQAQELRLIGITGNQEQNPAMDETIFDIDTGTAATTLIRQLAHVKDTDSIGWNPVTSELYHYSGAGSYRSDPTHAAYRDNYYLAGVKVYDYGAANSQDGSIINNGPKHIYFNANPPPADNPDPITGDVVFGEPGPFPGWILPTSRRTQAQTDDSYRNMEGPDETGSWRDVVYDGRTKTTYAIGGGGELLTYTPGDPLDPSDSGVQKIIGFSSDNPNSPDQFEEPKAAVLFHPVPGETQFLVGMRNDGFAPTELDIAPMDLATGEVDWAAGKAVKITDGNGNFVRNAQGIVGLAQDPDSGILYGIDMARIGGTGQGRSLLKFETFDSNGTLTGNAEDLGFLETPTNDAAFANLAFVGFMTGDMQRDGDVDFDDIPAFVNALTNPDDYKALLGVAARVSGDTDGDGDQDFDDITGFVALLQGPLNGATGVPEPSSLALVGAALLGLMGYGWRKRR